MIKVAFATGMNGEFGLNGGLPWNRMFKVDMDSFMEFTDKCMLVMGVKTFQSLPKKLRGLRHIVISTHTGSDLIRCKNGDTPDSIARATDVRQFLRGLSETYDVCVIGGKSLIEEALPIADKVLHTVVFKKFKHDDVEDLLDMQCDVSISPMHVQYSQVHIESGGNYSFKYHDYPHKSASNISYGVCVHEFDAITEISNNYYNKQELTHKLNADNM
jgi:dihydrofolate reductase